MTEERAATRIPIALLVVMIIGLAAMAYGVFVSDIFKTPTFLRERERKCAAFWAGE